MARKATIDFTASAVEGLPMTQLSHLDPQDRPCMVDVTNKPDSLRRAVAQGFIQLKPETVALIAGRQIRKGNVLITAELAGIQAAKQTALLIPLCHPLTLSKIGVNAKLCDDGIRVTAEVKCTGQTGVEMEALTAVSVALLTVYDLCKAVDKNMQIQQIHLIEKTKDSL
jgi:cyclic pyranopterin phosphate synthase